MNKKDKYVTIGGMKFSYLVFQDLLRPFKEAFSHASLTVEQAFKELEGYDLVLKSSMDQNAADYYDLLSTTEKNKINEILHQIIVYKGSRFGVFGGPIPNDQKQIDRLFNEHFKYFEQYLPFYTKYDSEGNFDKIATFNNIDTLFFNLPQRRNAYKRAVSMKEDNMNAFDYAISLKEITIPEIIAES